MKAVIYARQSLDKDGEGVAVERQISDCRRLAELRQETVAGEYIDNDRSATKGPRPEFDRLMADVERGEIDTIIVWHTDRLYRRLNDAVAIIALAEKHNLAIWTVQAGDVDLGTPTGRGIAVMMAAAARMEVEHKGARQKAANFQRAKKGQRHFGNRPFGYDRIDGEIVIVEPEAMILREAVNRFIAGDSWYSIAKDFRERGIVALSGRSFSYQNLRLRATNPALAGVHRYKGLDVIGDDGKPVEGSWPPILDRATWERLQTAIAVRARRQGWDKKVKYLGSGIYRCGKCGGRMKVTIDWNHGRNTRRPVYQCENLDVRRRLDRVDELVEARLLGRLTQPDALRLLSPSEDVAELAAESIEIRERMEGLAALFADGTLSAGAVRTEKAKLQDRLERLQTRIAAAEGGATFAGLLAAEEVEGFWRDRMEILAKRSVVEALLLVTIQPTRRGGSNGFHPEDVQIEWRSQ